MKASAYLPSVTFRYTLASLIVAILLVSGAYAYSQKSEDVLPTVVNTPAVKGDSATDSDKDGLKDWEENLIGTNMDSRDSDGDGTSDGEEVALGRDPLTKGPNDKLSGGASAQKGDTVASSTATDLFARQVFAKFSASQSGGGGVTGSDIQSLINSALAAPSGEEQRLYRSSDILINQSSSLSSLREYGNAMGEVLKRHPSKGSEGELAIFERALSTENETEIAKLDPIINTYEAILNDMLKVRVPKNAVGTHLDVLNALSRVAGSIRGMRQTFQDPVTGMQAFSVYPKNIEQMVAAFNGSADFLAAQGITFDSTEAGSLYVTLFSTR